MRALPGPLEAVDVRITQWMVRHGVLTLRVALGIVFFWFGVLNTRPRPHEHRAPATRSPSWQRIDRATGTPQNAAKGPEGTGRPGPTGAWAQEAHDGPGE